MNSSAALPTPRDRISLMTRWPSPHASGPPVLLLLAALVELCALELLSALDIALDIAPPAPPLPLAALLLLLLVVSPLLALEPAGRNSNVGYPQLAAARAAVSTATAER
jgi:hypothetical protein